ncbi:hypothetical protein Back2_13240 [Nocardioides baekrokdamisoli]|uniref:Lipoprotein n=1 Tax=Nocardioides baekrokdamisoli TaxID=1804624 RepID=A0A3G9IDK6_9ACTN|nr:hypothetical protein [Nocardioides baekrokdamisoli]BBH17037.1 hypothetical protein Back2_13240 [Nocardioides baekrokdamisoli]
MLTAASFRPAIAAALAAVGLVALTACSGSGYATAKPNVIANGGYGTSSDGQLRVNGAVIVATPPASGSGPATAGVFTANLAVAPQTNGATVSDTTIADLGLTGLAIDAGNPNITNKSDAVSAKITAPVLLRTSGVGAAGTLNMSDPAFGGIPVTGSFTPGEVIPVRLTLAKGQTVTLEVPVVKACGVYQFAVAPANPKLVTAYTNYVAGIDSLPALTETATPGTYECATPTLRDSQGASPEATATVTVSSAAKPTASASKH